MTKILLLVMAIANLLCMCYSLYNVVLPYVVLHLILFFACSIVYVKIRKE